MRIYVCSPYRADTPEGVERNVEFAQRCCRAIFDAGHVPVAPHLIFPQFCDDNNGWEREECLKIAKRELQNCQGMIVFGARQSEGMKSEISFAYDAGIPVAHASEPEGEIVFLAIQNVDLLADLALVRRQIEDLERYNNQSIQEILFRARWDYFLGCCIEDKHFDKAQLLGLCGEVAT